MAVGTLYLYDRTNAQWVPLNPIPYAHSVVTTTTNFGGILSGTDTTVQLALDTIDDHNHDSIYLNVARTDAYTPTANYHPATKKYVDDEISGIDLTAYLKKDGTVSLTADWDAGSWQIRAETFQSDVATGTAPLVVASTTLVSNLNADLLDGKHETSFFLADGTRYLPNNTYILARNAADTANINMFKVNASDVLEMGVNMNIGTYSLGDGTGTLVFDGSGNLSISGDLKMATGKVVKINNVAFLGVQTTGSAFVGENAGLASSGTNCFGGGYWALIYNTGINCMGIGRYSLRSNVGSNCFGIGAFSLDYNTGASSGGNGNYTLYRNCGDECFGAGMYTLYANNSNKNTALGAYSFYTWTDDAGSAVTFDNTDINITTDYITVTGHGFTGSYVNLKYTEGTSAITGMTDDTVYQFAIIDANTLQLRTGNITNAGSGTGHTLTPRVNYTNSTAVGAYSEPDASNQVMLGDTNVTQVATAGDFRSDSGVLMLAETTTPSAVADYGKIYTKNDNKLYFQDGAGVEHEVDLV